MTGDLCDCPLAIWTRFDWGQTQHSSTCRHRKHQTQTGICNILITSCSPWNALLVLGVFLFFWLHFSFNFNLIRFSPYSEWLGVETCWKTTVHKGSFCLHESSYWPHIHSLTSLLCIEGHKFGVGFDVVPLTGEGTSTNIVDPFLHLKTEEEQ